MKTKYNIILDNLLYNKVKNSLQLKKFICHDDNMGRRRKIYIGHLKAYKFNFQKCFYIKAHAMLRHRVPAAKTKIC